MADKERKDFIVSLPIDSLGANDPMIIERFPDHLRYIGLMVAAWSEIEYKLIALLAMELKVLWPPVASMLYAIESSGARLGVMGAAFASVSEKDETKRTELAGIIEEAQSLLFQRNKFAHSLYGDAEHGEMAILSMRKGTATDLPLHDLKHQFDRMRKLSYRVGREVSIRYGSFQEQPSEQHAFDVLRKMESDSIDSRIHPSPQEPPKPSRP